MCEDKRCAVCVYLYEEGYLYPCRVCDSIRTSHVEPSFKYFKSIRVFMKRAIVAKIGDMWREGNIGEGRCVFEKFNTIKKISDVADIDSYVSMDDFLKHFDIHPNSKESLLRRFEVNKMFIRMYDEDKKNDC